MSPRANESLIAVSKAVSKSPDFPAALRTARSVQHAEGAEDLHAACPLTVAVHTVAGRTELQLATYKIYPEMGVSNHINGVWIQ